MTNMTWKVSLGKDSLSGPWSPEMLEEMVGKCGKMERPRDNQNENPEEKTEKTYVISEDGGRTK